MTLFAFAEGQGLTEHMTPHDATVLVVEGAVRITIGSEAYEVETGQILHLPAGVPHALHEGDAFKMLLSLFKNPGKA
jgi:quercetin dioxygenase-like cupin family protein